ncbi:hypothetical protein B0J11DRAFT_579636 [Dendryphion nanum]|uniref:Uncharacterized protein n=1 Tax=Dendryphion nanum TaxID=256645 RepID=A0A9P9DXJ8_9PLEO|nr:hypothetical protein B0J11DRAFT_579636 [Dendryphion nanum]
MLLSLLACMGASHTWLMYLVFLVSTTNGLALPAGSSWANTKVRFTSESPADVADTIFKWDHDDLFINATLEARSGLDWTATEASDDLWNTAVCRGRKLFHMMLVNNAIAGSLFTPPQASASSPFRNFPGKVCTDEFNRWNWKFENAPCHVDYLGKAYYGIEAALEAYGVAKSGWRMVQAEHDNRFGPIPLENQDYDVDGRRYRSTGSYFKSAMNRMYGVVLLSSSYGPENEGQFRSPPVPAHELPLLKRLSDVVWGMWSQNAGPNYIGNVRYFFRWSITNIAASQIIKRALTGKKLVESYPCDSFQSTDPAPRDEAFYALLGSPNGLGVAYFLIQHKGTLGVKYVHKIDVFGFDSVLVSNKPILVFHISDSPQT